MGVQFYGIDVRRVEVSGLRPHPAIVGQGEGSWSMSMTLMNAAALLGLLGLGVHATGECTLAEARRAWIWATNTFDRRVAQFMRKPQTVDEEGKARAIIFGADEDYFARRLQAWIEFVQHLEAAGATHLCWA